MIKILILAFTLLVAVEGCGPSYVDPVLNPIVDCAQSDQPGIIDLVADFATDVLDGGGFDWAGIRQKALASGARIGGCALAYFVQNFLAPGPGQKAPEPEEGQKARTTLESVRAEFGNVSWKTADGSI